MKPFGVFVRESVDTVAYWISPRNEIISVNTTHIDLVIKNPELFGLTSEYIRQKYAEFDEPVGQEGKAREAIMVDLIKRGWVRIRKYRNKGYSINVPSLDSKRAIDNVFDFAAKITTDGIHGSKEADKYLDVAIVGLKDGNTKRLSLMDVVKGGLFESGQAFDQKHSLVLFEVKGK